MPYECVRPAILLQLARRQALRHLHVEVQSPQPGDEVPTGEMEVNDSTAMVELNSQFVMEDTGEHTIETMARFLLRCWPSVSLVWYNRAQRWPFPEPSRAAYSALLAKVNQLRDSAL
ncbi:hypothetical protein FRC12_003679 [Ceratobasidium sp. 428]|nr:hypothetical protein FRC12_003679 [Ceratobasidium sp. 428]